jgi:integrase/recombinase XerD
MADIANLPARATHGSRLSTIEQIADVPEQEIWLQRQKSPRTRPAYRLDEQHFMRTLSITSPAELRQADHKALIAWERYMRETEHAASSTMRRRLAALSSLYNTWSGTTMRRAILSARWREPAINSDEGLTLAFAKAQARKLLDMPAEDTTDRIARPRHPVGRVAGRVAARRDRRAQGWRPALEPRL